MGRRSFRRVRLAQQKGVADERVSSLSRTTTVGVYPVLGYAALFASVVLMLCVAIASARERAGEEP